MLPNLRGTANFFMDEHLDALPWDSASAWIEHRRVICIVGGQGSGKSRLGNVLTGREAAFEECGSLRLASAPSSSRSRGATTTRSGAVDFEHHFKLGDVCYRAIDTPPLQADALSESDGELSQHVSPHVCANGIDCFLYVCRWDVAFACSQLEVFEAFEHVYGPGALCRTALVFTRTADLSNNALRQELASSTTLALRACLDKIGGSSRCIGIDTESPHEVRREKQRAQILHVVDELARDNGFVRFNNAQTRMAREWRTAMEREITALPAAHREVVRRPLQALHKGECDRQCVELALATARRCALTEACQTDGNPKPAAPSSLGCCSRLGAVAPGNTEVTSSRPSLPPSGVSGSVDIKMAATPAQWSASQPLML